MKKLYIALLSVLMAASVAQAQRRTIFLQFGDQEHQRMGVLYLKQAIMQQHRFENPENLELESVTLVAKSQHGNGQADLIVGNWRSPTARIGGRPNDYWNHGDWTFDNVTMYNMQRTSMGPWQIELRGFNKVRRVMLVVRDRFVPPPRPIPQPPRPIPQPPRPIPQPPPGPSVAVSVKGQGYFPDLLTAQGVCVSQGYSRAVGYTQWQQAGNKIQGLRSYNGSAFFQSHIWYGGMALDIVNCQ